MPYQFSTITVLVVDDNQPMLDLVKSLLNVLGVKKVVTARNGQEAFHTVLLHKPDLIIADWMMKPMNGLELTKKIRTDPATPDPFVPIILMTGIAERRKVMKARDSGITEFLVKPFKVQELFRKIEYVIEKPRLQVRTDNYVGPDRRRRNDPAYKGERRRSTDRGEPAGILHSNHRKT